MKAYVVYESMYGNTHEIAEAIAAGLDSFGATVVGSVAELPPNAIADADLLIVGGPTHAHGMSRGSSRMAAVETAAKDDSVDAEPDAAGPGLREWFAELPKTHGLHAVAFDTRIDKPAVLTGSAAKQISKLLRKHRYTLICDPESFFVQGSEGPLQDGEVERARAWAQGLASQLVIASA